MRRPSIIVFLFVLAFFQGVVQVPAGELSEEDKARLLVRSEDLIDALRPALRLIDRSAARLKIPGSAPAGLFADKVELVDIAATPTPTGEIFSVAGISGEQWEPSGKRVERKLSELAIWPGFFSDVAKLEHAHFYWIDAHFPDPEKLETLSTSDGFEGLAELKDGR